GPRVGLTWDPNGDGRTSVRASYGRAYEFVNAQFHLNTSVAPPWGSEIRINSPSGGLDNPFINSAGQTNIFPVTFDQNAPFSLNGPFLSLNNNMASTHVDQWNITVERQFTSTWFASAGYLGSRTSNLGYDDGNCANDRRQNFSVTASLATPEFENRGLRVVASGWRLAPSFRATTGSWLTVTTGADRVLNGQAGTQRVNELSTNYYA